VKIRKDLSFLVLRGQKKENSCPLARKVIRNTGHEGAGREED
jgi:hypothetical protein